MTINEFSRPRRYWMRILFLTLKVYLAIFLLGCAGNRPKPEVEEVRILQTHTYSAEQERVFNASLAALQDLNYSIDVVNKETGLITASRHTTQKLAEITTESDDGLPTWVWVTLIATGVIVVVLLISTLSGDNKDEDEDRETAPEYYIVENEEDYETSGIEFYHYKITLKLEAISEAETRVRMSVEGSRLLGNKVMETGPVYDCDFFRSFFKSLDRAITQVSPDTTK